MAEPPLQACADTGATIVAEPSYKQASAIRRHSSTSSSNNQDDDDHHSNNNNNSEHEEDQPHDASLRVKRRSYRILGTHAVLPHESDDDGEEEDDPMAWADLEAFGGTRKTLAKKRPARKLTPDEVREQLEELHEIERRMQDAQREKRSKKGMIDTIAWLKRHNEAIEAAGANQKMKRSSSFVRSVLNFFSSGSRSRASSDDAHAPSSSNQRGHHTADLASNNNNAELSSSVFDDEYENFPKLAAPWGQRELNCSWPRLGFALLNQSIRYDIARVRAVMAQGGLGGATPQAIVAVAKWLTLFDQHVHDVITLKEYLLEERTVLAGVGYKVTTIYDSYNEALATALSRVHEDRRYLGDAIEHMFAELEAILEDEAAAVADVLATSLTETQEYDALSCLFHHLSDEEGCGVIVAKLLGWMKLHFDERDVKAFLAVFDHDMQDRIAGDWMRHYASYLHLLDEFAVHAETPMTFFT